MSATNRGAVRVEHDFYATPAWCVEAIAGHIDWDQVPTACEPCVGDGAIVRNCPKGPAWETFEIREGRDYLLSNPVRCALTKTNPPYALAAKFLAKSLAHSLCVSYLLRINFLGSTERKPFLTENRPTHLYTLSKRPSFVDVCDGVREPKRKGCGAAFQKDAKLKVCPECGGRVKAGTDATEYAWICWDKGHVMKDQPGMYFL